MFSGFDDNASYFVRAQGETLNGLALDTGYKAITAAYSTGTVFAMVEANNAPWDGKIHVKSNIVSATGEVYTLANKKVTPIPSSMMVSGTYTDPTTGTSKSGIYAINLGKSHKMVYNDGFKFTDNYTLVLVMWNLSVNQTVVTIGSDVTVYYRVGKFTANKNQAVFELVVKGKKYSYKDGNKTYTSAPLNDVYLSEVIDQPSSSTKLGLVITRDGARYSIHVTPGVTWSYS